MTGKMTSNELIKALKKCLRVMVPSNEYPTGMAVGNVNEIVSDILGMDKNTIFHGMYLTDANVLMMINPAIEVNGKKGGRK